ncbi:MAG: EamA family transporter [Gammaproteobacteria bacterium]|nr:EamA family transporter [Gammaproteobacteria bacterium]
MAISVPIIWGGGFLFAKAAINHFPPILLMAFRFAITALMLVWFVKPPVRLLNRIFWIALVSAAIQYSMTFTGLRDLDASTAVIVVQLEVPFGVLLAVILLKDKLTLRRIFGMVLAFIGVIITAGEPRLEGNLFPILLVVGGAFTWALGQVLIKTLGAPGGFTLIAWVAVFATPQLFLSSWIFEDNQLEAIMTATPIVWAAVIYLAVVMTSVGYAIWYHLLGLYNVNQVMPYLLLLPVVTVFGGVMLLGDTLTPSLITGGLLAIAGVALITLEKTLPLPQPEKS